MDETTQDAGPSICLSPNIKITLMHLLRSSSKCDKFGHFSDLLGLLWGDKYSNCRTGLDGPCTTFERGGCMYLTTAMP